MSRVVSLSGKSFALSLIALAAAALPCSALTPPAVLFSATDSNNVFSSVLIDATGAVTYGGACNPATCPGTHVTGAGFISFTGKVGPFSINNAVFTTKPLVAPQIDFGLGTVSTGSLGGTLSTTFTDTGFNVASGPVKLTIAQTAGVSTTYNAWFDPNNQPFAETKLIGNLSNNVAPIANPAPMNVTVTTEPVSLTGSEVFTLGPNATYSNDYEVQATLLPIMLSCTASGSGEVGVSFSSLPAVSGGVTPYMFSIATGTLPNGITLNPTTGLISGTATVAGSFTIQVKDANGVVASGTCPYTFVAGPSLTCSANNSGEVGVSFSSMPVVSGGTAPYTYSIATGALPNGITLNATTGLVSGTATAPGSFTIKVTDAKGITATGTCPYTFVAGPSLTCSANNSGEVGVPFSSMPVVSGGTAPYTYAIATGALPNGITLNATTGLVSGTATAPGSFTIKVTDAKGITATGTCPYTFVARPSLTCSANNSGEVGVPFSSMPVVSGGTAPYTYAIATGALPNGITLNATTGLVSGTATAPGSFTIKVTDAKGITATGPCPYAFIAGPSLTCSANNSGEVGVPFSSMPVVSGGTAPYTYTIATGALPNGITLNATTGLVSGTATAPGSFTIKVTDAKGITATGTCPYTFAAGPSLTCSANNSGEVGVPFSSMPVVSGGTTPYTYSIATGALPNGITLNATTGLVSGTATAPGSFTIKVTDAKGITATGTCLYTFVARPSLTCSANNSGEVGVPFSSMPVVSGGTAPYTYTIATGALPNGITLNATTGLVSGTATGPGSFTIKVTDAKGITATGTCPYTFVARPSLTCSAVNSGTVGTPFNSPPPTVIGGITPYVFSVIGTLPAGLMLNTATGAITGTPTAAGSFSIRVTDAKGVIAAGSCPYTITACLLSKLGAAGSFSILGLQNAQIDLSSGPLQVNGNVGIGMNGRVHLSGGAQLNSTLYADPSATVQVDGGSSFKGGTVTESFTAIQNAALALSASAALLTPTQTFGQIQNATTIVGNGGQNVIAVNGQLHLSGGQNLTISGGPNDSFIFNIAQGFQLDGGANIVLVGVQPNQVLFNFPGNGQQVQTSGNADTAGIFLAPTENIQINGGVHNSIFISGGHLSFQSNPVVNALPACVPTPLALSCPATTGVVGSPYSSGLVAVGGTSPYTYSIVSGSIAPLFLNPTTGTITGTPTMAGTLNFTGQVVDSSGNAAINTVTAGCAIVVTPTPPFACLIPPNQTIISGTSWNSFNTQGSNNVVWVHAHIGGVSGLSTTTKTTLDFTGVTFTVNGKAYAMPDGLLIFDPAAPATPTTTFDPTFAPNGRWTTTFNPNDLSDEMFFVGNPILVDSNISGGGQANFSYTVNSTDPTFTFDWQWSAAVFTFWPFTSPSQPDTGNNAAMILPFHNSDHAGTPENTTVQQSLIQGPRGGGGANFTGSWSATGHGTCVGNTLP